MAETVKNEIKQNAVRRRERLKAQDQEIVVMTERDFQISDAEISVSQLLSPAATAVFSISTPAETEEAAGPSPVSMTGRNPFESTGMPKTLNLPLAFPARGLGSSLNSGRGVELGFVMIYLDHVFPFLFPFYRPSLLETGRHWLLSLLCQNEVSFYTAASLSSYFYSVVQQDARQETQEDCKALVWTRLLEQIDMAVRTIQQDIADINRHGVQAGLIESAHVLGEIVQLLIVEVTVRRNVDWNIHLTPALAIFEDIFKYHGSLSTQPNLEYLLNQFPPPFAITVAHNKPLPNTADQSALLFFMAILLFVDVISSTSFDRPPRLQSFHAHLLSSTHANEAPIKLEAYIGCQNWVLLAISDISTLGAWKKNAKSAGNLSVINLVNRAGPISQTLEQGLVKLDASLANNTAGPLNNTYTRFEDLTTNRSSIATATRIWAHAAYIYLSVVLSGWQPSSPDIQNNVTKVLNLLQDIKAPAQLRSLAWPLCIAGCLALPYQEELVRAIIKSMGELKMFGSIGVVEDIVEEVWRKRDMVEGDNWDVAACLRIFGSPALLV